MSRIIIKCVKNRFKVKQYHMKKYIFATLLYLVSLDSLAQSLAGTFSLIPRLGVNVSTLSGNSYYYVASSSEQGIEDKPVMKGSFTGGVDLMYQFTDVLGGSIGVFYSLQGCRYKDHEEYYDNAKLLHGVRRNVVNLHCLNVPLMLHGYAAEGLSVNVGLQVGFPLHAKSRHEWEEYTVDAKGKRTFSAEGVFDANVTGNFKKVELAVPMGISYEYMNVVLDARYNLGITNIAKVDNVKDNGFMFTVGYKFDL